MRYIKFTVFLLISLPSPIIRTVNASQQRSVPNLRRYTVKGVAGRFVVDRDALEREIQIRKQQDALCGQDVKIQLPQLLPHAPYNVSFQGEVTFASFTITDDTLAAELLDDLREQVPTSHHFFGVDLPIVIGMTKTHALLPLRHFTNSTKKVTFSGSINSRDLLQVDSIVEGEEGTVTVRLGDDVMVYQVGLQDDIKCKGKTNVGKDFDQLTSEVMRITDYPIPFDWGCELLGSQISFCQRLDGFRCALARVGGDVCTLTSTSLSERSPTTMKVINVTGIFQEMIPFLAETVPNESFEAELVNREHTAGIAYPCLTS